MKNNKRKNKGITLVALVVTIIILLILAGVSIRTINGENGIFAKTQVARDESKKAEYKEQLLMAKTEAILEKEGQDINLDEYIEQIKNDKINGIKSIEKMTEEKAKVITKEGYIFIITVNTVDYYENENNLPEMNIEEANVEFEFTPNTWTNGKVEVTVSKKENKNEIQLSKDGTKWTTTNKMIFEENGIIYARLKDDIGRTSDYVSRKIDIIDTEAPNTFTPEIESTTNSITVKANATDKSETSKSGASGIEGYRFSKDDGNTWTEYQTSGIYTFDNMLKNIEGDTYNIKVQVKDRAQNTTTSSIKASTQKNMEYYIEGKDKLLVSITQNQYTRNFYKYSNKGAIAGLVFANTKGLVGGDAGVTNANWIAPILVSTDIDAVTYYCTDNGGGASGNLGSYGNIVYKDVTYYYSSKDWWMPNVTGYDSTLTPLRDINSPFTAETGRDALKSAAIDLIKKYVGE